MELLNSIINFIKKFKISEKIQQNIYRKVYLFTWILYVGSILGILTYGKDYFDEIQKFILIYVSLFLVIKFNPLTKSSSNRIISKFDKEIIFHAGVFILLSTLLNTFLSFLDKSGIFTKKDYENLFGEQSQFNINNFNIFNNSNNN